MPMTFSYLEVSQCNGLERRQPVSLDHEMTSPVYGKMCCTDCVLSYLGGSFLVLWFRASMRLPL